MADPLVSVVIPTHNRAALVCKAVDSVLEQTYREVEIIVVDDGSTDDTRQRLNEYGHRIHYIHQEWAGRCAARNVGIHRATGEYLTFLDSDDLFLPHKLEKQVAFLEQNQDVDLVYGNGFTMTEDSVLAPLEPFVRALPGHTSREVASWIIKESFIPHIVVLMRRRTIPAGTLFDEKLSSLEDWDLWLRLVFRGARIAYEDDRVAIYRRHSTNSDIVDPMAHLAARSAICAKVILQDLDSALPHRLRQDFRLAHLGAIIRSRSSQVIFPALRVILQPNKLPSMYGIAGLASRLVVLSAKAFRKSLKLWWSSFLIVLCKVEACAVRP